MDFLKAINDAKLSGEERLSILKEYETKLRSSGQNRQTATGETNNHIHTIYSYSPYTPSMAALKARDAGLAAAGSVDHDSITASREMNAACAVLGIGGCSGFELRVSFKKDGNGNYGPFAERKINNPDSRGLAYMTVQGIPAPATERVKEFLLPLQKRRNERNKAMCAKASSLLNKAGYEALDFENDVYPISMAHEGGSITERHLMAALADKVIKRYGKGPALVDGLMSTLDIRPAAKLAVLLRDPDNPHYLYDLLGVLKTDFLPRIFIQPDEQECIPATEAVSFACSIGAIPAYAYLGDVGESVTGDKKAEHFEDAYLDELFVELGRTGYKAVAYMPPRNSRTQLQRIRRLCSQHGFMEISGVDINSSRQGFNCPELLEPDFMHLVDTSWALIAHEKLASINPDFALFSDRNPLSSLTMEERLVHYAAAGKALNRLHPMESAYAVGKKLLQGEF